MADATYQPLVYRQQGSTKLVVASGGILDIESGGALQIAGVAITASAAELNAAAGSAVSSSELQMLDGCIPGTAVAGKAVVCATTKKHVDILAMTELNVGAGTSVGIAITSGDINLIDGLTAGTLVASKAVTVGAAKQVNEICISNLFSGATTGGVELTSGDLTLIDGLTAGTLLASKAVTVGAAKQVNEICISNLFLGATTGGVEITSGDATLIDGLTAGTLVASKAVTVGAAKQVNEICISSLFLGATTGGVEITSGDADLIDGITKGTVAAGKAVVCASTKMHVNSLAMTNFYLGAGSSVGYELTSDSFLTTAEGTLITGITEGTVAVGKAVVSATTKKNIDALSITNLFIGAGTSVGAELTSDEGAMLDGAVVGTVTAGKALVVDTSKKVDVLVLGELCIGTNTSASFLISASVANLNALASPSLTSNELLVLDAVTAGTVAVGKAVVVDTSKKVDTLVLGELSIGTNTSAAFLVTATAPELNLNDDQLASVSWTISTESAADVITITAALKDAAGTAMARPCPILFAQLNDTCGSLYTAATTVGCSLTSGSLGGFIPIVAGKLYQGISSTSGFLVVSWTDTSSNVLWYPGIVLPNGKWSIGAAVECTS